MADVQFHQVRHLPQRGKVLIIQAVAGVDLQPQVVRLSRGGPPTFQFPRPFPFAVEILRERAGVQFNELAAGTRRRLNLRGVGGDEKAGARRFPGRSTSSASPPERVMIGHIQSPFGGDFGPPFRHQANDVRFDLQRDLDDFRGAGHFKVEPGLSTWRSLRMSRSCICRRSSRKCAVMPWARGGFANQRRLNRVRLAAVQSAIARLAQRRNVVDIDAQFEHG